MKFAFIADLHLSRYSQDKIDDESDLPERLYSIRNALDEVATYCLDNNIETIIVGGDLLHAKSIIYAIAQDLMIQFFEDYTQKGIRFIVIDGNHDLSGKGEKVVSALRPLGNIGGVTWVKFDQICPIDNILLVPYSYNLPKIIKESKSQIMISHFGLSEAMLSSGMSVVSDISIKDLVGRYELVLLGHYHKPQEIILPNMSLYYVGSLIQLDWGEKGDEKRFLVVDSKTLEVESITLNNYKKHIEIEINSSNVEEGLKAAKIAKESGNHVKVIMKEKVDLSSVKGEFNIIDKTEVDITNRGITSSMSMDDKFIKYMSIKNISETEQARYLQIVKSIIDEAEI